jgi:hypothetical protein
LSGRNVPDILHARAYMRAKPIHDWKVTDEDGDIREFVVWEVVVDGKYPEGVKYRLAFIPRGARRPAVLYDNHHPKGHHKHLEALESPYAFSGVEDLMADFERDIARWKARGRQP